MQLELVTEKPDKQYEPLAAEKEVAVTPTVRRPSGTRWIRGGAPITGNVSGESLLHFRRKAPKSERDRFSAEVATVGHPVKAAWRAPELFVDIALFGDEEITPRKTAWALRELMRNLVEEVDVLAKRTERQGDEWRDDLATGTRAQMEQFIAELKNDIAEDEGD